MKVFWFLHSPAKHPFEPEEQTGSRRMLLVTALVLGTFLGWAYWAELDEITRAPGAVISSSRTQIVQSQDGGILKDLLVQEGDTVEAGQILARLERTRAESSFLETRAKAAGLAATAARLRAEVFGGQPRFEADTSDYPEFRANQMALFKRRKDALDEELKSIEESRALITQELLLNEPLVSSGDVSRTEVLRLQRQVADLKAQITNKKNKYFQDAQSELNRAEEELAGVSQLMAQRMSLLDQTELVSPMRGVVKNVRITTQGGVIRAGEEVMQIVPLEDDLLVEAKVSPASIAFLHNGLEADVKLDAYDYTIYGSLPAKLIFISADTLSEDLKPGEQPYYRARFKTSGRQFRGQQDGRINILPGMTATVEVKTGRRTVLQYLTKPIFKTLNESMGER